MTSLWVWGSGIREWSLDGKWVVSEWGGGERGGLGVRVRKSESGPFSRADEMSWVDF